MRIVCGGQVLKDFPTFSQYGIKNDANFFCSVVPSTAVKTVDHFVLYVITAGAHAEVMMNLHVYHLNTPI